MAAVIRSVPKGDSNRAGGTYGRIASSSSESGIGGRLQDDDRRDDDRVERAMVGIIIGFFVVFLNRFVYKEQFVRYFVTIVVIYVLN